MLLTIVCPSVLLCSFSFSSRSIHWRESVCLSGGGQAEREGHLGLRGAWSWRQAPSHDLKSGPGRENQEADA